MRMPQQKLDLVDFATVYMALNRGRRSQVRLRLESHGWLV